MNSRHWAKVPADAVLAAVCNGPAPYNPSGLDERVAAVARKPAFARTRHCPQ